MKFSILGFFCLIAVKAHAENLEQEIKALALKVASPSELAAKLEVLGNSTPDEAHIILLPEVHDDPHSLLTQLELIAALKKKPGRTIFLGESILAFNQSSWELFSQKTLNILCAKLLKGPYTPKSFEELLKKLALTIKHNSNKLNWSENAHMWVLSDFDESSTILYGWDLKAGSRLIDRNNALIEVLKKALKNYDRVVVTLGARHVPELEYLSSLKLLCPKNQGQNIKEYFKNIKEISHIHAQLPYGVGATHALYEFLQEHKYAVLFDQSLYQKLDNAVLSSYKCLNLNNKKPRA